MYGITCRTGSMAVNLTVSHWIQQVLHMPAIQLHRPRTTTPSVVEWKDSPLPLINLLLLHLPLPNLPPLNLLPHNLPFLLHHPPISEEMVPPLPPLKFLDVAATGMIVKILDRIATIPRSGSVFSHLGALSIQRQATWS